MAQFFSALADSTRLRLLYLMREGGICVCFLQGVLQTNQPKVSRHLAYLKKAGLVVTRREGKWMYYSLAKVEPEMQAILNQTFRRLEKDKQSARDAQRVKQINCCPADYGVSLPETNKRKA